MIGMLSWVKIKPEYYSIMPADIRPRLDTLVFEVRYINRRDSGSAIGAIDLVCVNELLPNLWQPDLQRRFYLRSNELIEI